MQASGNRAALYSLTKRLPCWPDTFFSALPASHFWAWQRKQRCLSSLRWLCSQLCLLRCQCPELKTCLLGQNEGFTQNCSYVITELLPAESLPLFKPLIPCGSVQTLMALEIFSPRLFVHVIYFLTACTQLGQSRYDTLSRSFFHKGLSTGAGLARFNQQSNNSHIDGKQGSITMCGVKPLRRTLCDSITLENYFQMMGNTRLLPWVPTTNPPGTASCSQPGFEAAGLTPAPGAVQVPAAQLQGHQGHQAVPPPRAGKMFESACSHLGLGLSTSRAALAETNERAQALYQAILGDLRNRCCNRPHLQREPREERVLLSSSQAQPKHEGSSSLSQEQHGHSTASCHLPSRSTRERGKARGGSDVVTRMLKIHRCKIW